MTPDGTLIAYGISKSYGDLEALHDLSFEVGQGEILALLGPNGAGKTTAIRVLTTIFTPTRGSFSLDGIPHTRPAEKRSRIGVLPESTGYPPHLNVASLQKDIYVDPEDWSETRTVFFGPIGPGDSRTLKWKVHGLFAGDFAVYVVVLAKDSSTVPVSSDEVHVHI